MPEPGKRLDIGFTNGLCENDVGPTEEAVAAPVAWALAGDRVIPLITDVCCVRVGNCPDDRVCW